MVSQVSGHHERVVIPEVRCSEIDRLKGILISLVVLGHNTLFSEWSPRTFNLLYNFHVAAFLLLPFLFSTDRLSRYSLADRATRYLVPQFVFFTVACIAYFFIFVPKFPTDILAWVRTVILAVGLSSETFYNDASGFRIFWFLPALFTLAVMRACYVHAGGVGKTLIAALTVVAHLGLGLLPADWLMYIPWGLPIVLFIFPLGLLADVVWRHYRASLSLPWVFAGLFLFCLAVSWSWNAHVALAGEPRLHSVLNPEWLLFHDAFLISALFGLMLVAKLLPFALLEMLGSASLFILLTHGLFWQTLEQTGLVRRIQSLLSIEWIAVLASYALTLLACLALYKFLQAKTAVWTRMFPRDRSLWRRNRVPAEN